MKATLTFKERSQAETFATEWGRYSKTGHVIGSGLKNVEVTVFNINDKDRQWIDGYISSLNNKPN